jgi:D-amino peptidase
VRFYISVDSEGMPWAPYRRMQMPGDPLYNELREIMTLVTNTVVDELYENGATEVIVADSHGDMVNIDPFKLDKRATLIRGFPRPLSMIIGAEEADAALFLGYHTSPQQGGVLAHTYSGRIVQRVEVAGCKAATEYLLNTLALGEIGKPVIFVAGDWKLGEQVARFTPWSVFIPLKKPLSFFADITKPWPTIEETLRKGVRAAVKTLEKGDAKPLKPEQPEIVVEVKRPYHADIAELFPCVERLDGVTIRLKCNSFRENFKLVEGIIMAAYALER